MRITLAYLTGIVAGSVLAGLVSLPFMHAADHPFLLMSVISSLFTGNYMAPFLPLVVISHISLRNIRRHQYFPFMSLCFFGILFPLISFVYFQDQLASWPDEFWDMNAEHIMLFLLLAASSTLFGLAATSLVASLTLKPAVRSEPRPPPAAG